MTWNWQQEDWGKFSYDKSKLQAFEEAFLRHCGEVIGSLKHLGDEEQSELRVTLLRDEAMQTSKIEGEYLDRDSIQSSIRRHFGLQVSDETKEPKELKEQGISDLLVDVYQNYEQPLSHDLIRQWNKKLFSSQGQSGEYRTHAEAIQVVSGAVYAPTVHFEAPPSAQVFEELEAFIQWYNQAHEEKTIPPLRLAGIAHLWFECIHPFADGNGRVGRALAEKSLSQSLGAPALISLSSVIEKKKSAYYTALEQANKGNEITKWLEYFLPTMIEAQQYTLQKIGFIIEKGKLLHKYQGQLNERQLKAVLRMFREGVEGFKGGLRAKNYMTITQTSQPTATRDLRDLVEKGVLKKTGELRYTRYWLNI